MYTLVDIITEETEIESKNLNWKNIQQIKKCKHELKRELSEMR